MSENPKFTNRLAKAKSPYLLQHKHNPVDWYEWGEEAFEKARLENKPIFLSVGYSTCHWCHVMAHESFEDEETAKMMNDAFVNIKVDREERPDIDHIYMTVCQIMNGSGGWPLSVIMTPQRKPFFAGTYFPRVTTGTRFGMQEISKRTVELWQDKRAEILESAEEFANELNKNITETAGHGLQSSIMRKAYHELAANYDEIQGGFGDHPKFPVPHNLSLLMRYHKHAGSEDAAKMVENTLQKMRMGGIWDHIGYGFHRYSTDSEWLLPHFEKMLYDQALMLIAYSEAYQLFGKAEYKETAEEIIAYVTHDLRSEEGGFFSAEDADSEGEEGKFYLWEINEVRKALIGDADFYCDAFNIESDGNYRDERSKEYTGKNIPHRRMSYKELADANNQSVEQIKERIDDLRGKLFAAREERVRPGLDDKILTDWNGLMIAALSLASRALDNSDYLELAQETYNFINANMFTEDGKLLHRYREGESGIHAMIDDYAYLIWAAIELYESTLNYVYLDDAIALTDKMIEEYWDAEQLGFYFTGKSGELLIARRKELYDGAMPSGNSINLMNLARLYKITGNKKYGEYANKTQLAFASQVSKVPSAFSQFIMGFDFLTPSSKEVVIVGDDGDETRELILELKSLFLPSTSFIYKNVNVKKIERYAEFTKNMEMIDGKPTVYICTDFACGQPSNDIEQIKKELSK